jgi:hypothetical protein
LHFFGKKKKTWGLGLGVEGWMESWGLGLGALRSLEAESKKI